MRWLSRFFHRSKQDARLDSELRFHVEQQTADNIAAGMSADEARRRALAQFGGLEYIKEETRDARGTQFVESLAHDTRFALRMLRKSPGFTAVAVLTLALGIGANTAIFSITDQVLLRNLPVPNPQQLVTLRSPGPNPGLTRTDFDGDAGVFSYPMYKDLREHATSVFSGLLACFDVDLNVSGHGSTRKAKGELVSGNYFEALRVTPAIGRVFSMDDETSPGANPVAVLSYGYWSRQFGGDASILNKTLIVNGVALTVVGVSRQGFQGVEFGSVPDIFIPLTMKPQIAPRDDLSIDSRTDHWLPLIGRLRPGTTRARAQAMLQPVYGALLPGEAKLLKLSGSQLAEFLAKPLQLRDGGQGRPVFQENAKVPLLVLMGMVGLVLLIACANLASLVMARGEARQREIAVRFAMGAARWRVVHQLLTESFLVAVAGGAAGLFLGSWCLSAVVGAIPPDVGMAGLETALDARVLWFAVGVTLLTCLLFSLAPAIRASRVSLQVTLKDQGSSLSEGRSSVALRKVLITAQVALTVVLLVAAGLLARSLVNMDHANLGLHPDHILQFSVEPGLNGASPAQTLEFADRARREISVLPGVRSVAASVLPIFSDEDAGFSIVTGGYGGRPFENVDVLYDWVGPDYFSTMGIPLISGRAFTQADTATSPKVAIVNQTLARQVFGTRSPIGLPIGDMQVVGVAGDSKWDGPRHAIVPFLYEPYTQNPRLAYVSFYVRTKSDPAAMAATLSGLIRRLDPNLPVNDLRTLADQVNASMFNDRLVAILSVSLALLAALLAALGLYGVLVYVVARRTREIGIRMVLGGQRDDILLLVLHQALWLVLAGCAVGVAGALIVTRWLASLLYGVTARDPLTFAGVPVLLVIVSAAACYIPARRAMRVDPMVALRHE